MSVSLPHGQGVVRGNGRRAAFRQLLVAGPLALALSLTGLPGLAPSAVADTGDPDLTSGLSAREGIDARLDALTVLAGLRDDPPSKQAALPLHDADEHARAALEHVRGDTVVDRATFDHDIEVVGTLKTMPGQGTDGVWIEVGAPLLKADRIAAARELDSFLTLPFTELTATVGGDGRTLTRAEVIETFMTDYRKSRPDTNAHDYVNAIGHARDAWQLVHGAVVDYWTVNDPDHDLLPNDREQSAGTDPDAADTDGDGLSDAVELLTTMTDPRSTSTYDGVADQDVDTDKDGLSNAAELRQDTDPIDPDSDGDTLSDGVEGLSFPSDPLRPDTDDDGLTDDSEKRLGTDPRDPDSDDDGTRDGDETYTTHADDDATGVAVAMTGVGDVAKTVSFSTETPSPLYQDLPGRISDAVDLSTDEEFSTAEVSFEFDASAVPNGDVDGLAVGWYDEEAGSLVPMPTTIRDGRATAVTTHFTTFVLFYLPDWNTVFDLWDPNPGGGSGDGRFVDVMLTLDSSGSMSTSDPQGLRRIAAKRFVDGLIEGDRAGVVDFDYWGYLTQPLTTDHDAVKAAIDRIDDSGSTDIAAGVRLGNRELIDNGDPEHLKVQILLTDGDGYYDPSLTQQAVDNDITIFTIGLGSYVKASLLQGIATATGGQYFAVADADDLPDVFDRIGGDIGDGEDLDKDGLDDLLELTGIVTGTGLTVYTDPRDPDTDGDGLLDGDELSRERDYSAPYPVTFYKMWSEPHSEDSDGDGLRDPEELDLGMDAMDADMDDDDVNDGVEYVSAWDVDDENPDGDQYDDGEELREQTDPFTYDPSLADRTRALVAGALLGETGYWLADQGLDTKLSIAYPPVGPPSLVMSVEFVDACDIPLVKCTELMSFQPMFVDRAEYVFGMVTLGLIPFVDIVVAIRDTIGAALQGEWGWAIFEVAAGALGFFVPVAGDIPGIIKDVGKWLARAVDFGKKSDELVAFVAKAADDTPAAEEIFIPIVKGLKEATYNTLSGKGISDADIIRLAKGGQDLDDLALVVNRADEIGSAGRFFDETATRGHWGREAENEIRTQLGGVAKRFDTDIDGVGHFRIADSARQVGTRWHLDEVKTGDGRLDDRMLVQITKDEFLLDSGDVREITWHFFPSGRSNRLGPDPDLLDELRLRGIKVKIWLP